ncbi:MAG: NRDE family protein [Burkholderiales bacterium]
MCLILLAWKVHARFPLLVAANRDEYHARPAERAAFWRDRPAVLAGRDLEASGTWMGVARSGKFSAVTNYRGAHEPRAVESRGQLVTRFLDNGTAPAEYVRDVSARGSGYSGFNLLASDGDELWWVSNRGGSPHRLEPGIYGLGNHLLNADEAVVREGKARLAACLVAPSLESLFALLLPAKIIAPVYGTRCSTVLAAEDSGRVSYAERAFDAAGNEGETLRYEFAAG